MYIFLPLALAASVVPSAALAADSAAEVVLVPQGLSVSLDRMHVSVRLRNDSGRMLGGYSIDACAAPRGETLALFTSERWQLSPGEAVVVALDLSAPASAADIYQLLDILPVLTGEEGASSPRVSLSEAADTLRGVGVVYVKFPWLS